MSRAKLVAPCALAFVLLATASASHAQEIEILGPLPGACIARLDRYHMPASLEWTYWIGSGVSGIRQDGEGHVSTFFSAGAELTTGVLTYPGFPAPRSQRPFDAPRYRADRAELRLGPWGSAEVRSAGALVEGGVTALLGTTDDYLNRLVDVAPYGMFNLRLGAGYAAFPDGRSPHVAIGLGWGYRFVFDRHSWGGACDPEPAPATLADATLVRLVATVRRATDFPATELVIAIEVSPTMVLARSRARQRPRRD